MLQARSKRFYINENAQFITLWKLPLVAVRKILSKDYDSFFSRELLLWSQPVRRLIWACKSGKILFWVIHSQKHPGTKTSYVWTLDFPITSGTAGVHSWQRRPQLPSHPPELWRPRENTSCLCVKFRKRLVSESHWPPKPVSSETLGIRLMLSSLWRKKNIDFERKVDKCFLPPWLKKNTHTLLCLEELHIHFVSGVCIFTFH